MKINANDIRPGTVLEIGGKLFVVLKRETVQPGKGGAFAAVEMKDIRTGTKVTERFRTQETVERAQLDDKVMQFLFMEGNLATFMDQESFEQMQISRDLILSIFMPGTALHDGAVVIQKERVAAAACFLPLSVNPAISSKLGTRHRAGIGITEETDCLSLIVSEETGAISVASFGVLEAGVTITRVDERLNQHFGVRRRNSTPSAPGSAPRETVELRMRD